MLLEELIPFQLYNAQPLRFFHQRVAIVAFAVQHYYHTTTILMENNNKEL